MKRKLFWFSILFLVFFLTGCKDKKNEVISIEVTGEQTVFDEQFRLSDISVRINKADGSYEMKPLDETMLSDADLSKLNQEGQHEITVTYEDVNTTFVITVKGEKGADGREIELRVADGNIQMRYTGEASWRNLVSLEFLQGLKGESGNDGREVELRSTETAIQWRYTGEAEWQTIIQLVLLKGPKGDDGNTPSIEISPDGYWVINGVKTTSKATGQNDDETCVLTFDPDGGSMPGDFPETVVNIAKGDSLTLPIPRRPGHYFKGWFTGDAVNDGQFYNFIPVTKDMTLHARWEFNPSDLTELYQFFSDISIQNFTSNIAKTWMDVVNEQPVYYNSSIVEKVFSDQGNLLFKIVEIPESVGLYEEKYGFNKEDGHFTLSRSQPGNPLFFENKVYGQTFIERTLMIFLKYGTFFRPGQESIFVYQMDNGVIYPAYYEIFNPTDNTQMEILVQSVEIKFSIDAAAKTIKYDMYWSGLPYITYDIQFTDIGSTIFSYPSLEAFKAICVNQIDAYVAGLDLAYVTPDSLNAFQSFVNTHKQAINGETDIFLVAAKMNQAYYDAIPWFTFQYDILAMTKDTSIRSITDYYNAASIGADEGTAVFMANLFNTCTANINDSTTVEQVTGYESQFYTDINNLANA